MIMNYMKEKVAKSILTIFDDMENPIPKWYRRDMCDNVAHI